MNTSKDHHLSLKGEYNKSMLEYLDLGHMRYVTCYWTIRQKVVPTCKHAMVAIIQESEHKALVKRFIANINKTARAVPAWSDCTGQLDHFIFYDGSSTNDPVLAKYCGDKWLPRIVSKGPEMLIAFHSNPFSVPLQSGHSIRDFNQDVGILFADSYSFDIGHLHSPRHTLAPNTTCTYHILGMPADLVGIPFIQYHLRILQPSSGSASRGDNSTIGRSDPLPSITRTHVWDSVGTFVPVRTMSPTNILSSSSLIGPSLSYGSTISGRATSSIPGMTAAAALFHQLMSQIVNNYYTAGNQNGMNINISVHFDEVYYHAVYDFIQVPKCRRRLRLHDSGHEDELHFPLRSHYVSSCDGLAWYIEAQQQDRSLLVRTGTIFLPLEPAIEYFAKYNARNRLIVYGSAPLKVMRVICPLAPSSRSASQHIFSEYWSNNQPFLSFYRPVSMVLEPIHKEPHSIGFSWLKIERTNASFIQQLDLQTNFTANDTLVDFGLYPRETEFEYRCPELDVCIGSALWCHGRSNCTYGYHECEQEYGSHPIELPAAIYAAFCCAAAAISAYLIFYLLLMVKKRHKASEKLKSSARAASLHATLSRKEYKKQSLFFYPGSCYGLQPFEYIHVDRETTV